MVQKQHGGGTGLVKGKRHQSSLRDKGKGKQRKERGEDEEEKDKTGTGTGMTAAEDDPSNWRGDSSVTNSFIAGAGLGVGISGPSSNRIHGAGEKTSKRQTMARGEETTEVEVDLEERGGSQRQRIDLFDQFSHEPEEEEEESPDPHYSWGTVPAHPIPPAHYSQGDGSRDPRTRGASVQLDEIGQGMNWDALEDCRPRESKR
jgi:hypothetical protein